MKLSGTKLFGVAFMMAILIAGLSSRSYGYRINVQSDSVTLITTVGASTGAWIPVFDGRDTIPSLPKGTIHVSFSSSSSELTMTNDSIIQFVGMTWLHINFTPTSLHTVTGTLTIAGDSNTIYVSVVGTTIGHLPVTVSAWQLDSLPRNHDYCPAGTNAGVYNENPDSLIITKVVLTDDPKPGIQFHFQTTPSVPMTMPGNASYGLWWICVNTATTDSNDLVGILTVYYTYHGIDDSATTLVYAHIRPFNTACLTTSDGNFGSVTEGGSVMKSITITNITNSVVHLDSAQLYGSDFSLAANSFPLTIPAGSSRSVDVTLSVPSPSAADHFDGTLTVFVRGTSPDSVECSTLYVSLSGQLLIPVVDTITLDVPPDSASLTITAHAAKTRHVILIHNTSSNKLLLRSLSVSSSDTTVYPFFYSGRQVYLYDSLASGETSGPIYLTLEAPDTGTYTLDLTLTYTVMTAHSRKEITSDNSYHYTVVAHRLSGASAAVTPRSAEPTADFSLSPNPAHGFVAIHLPEGTPSQIEIYDVLGDPIFHTEATGEFQWNGREAQAATGSYIVKIIVRHSDGTISTASKRLVFVR